MDFYFTIEPSGKEICSVETLRKALNVSCRVAITVVVVIGKLKRYATFRRPSACLHQA